LQYRVLHLFARWQCALRHSRRNSVQGAAAASLNRTGVSEGPPSDIPVLNRVYGSEFSPVKLEIAEIPIRPMCCASKNFKNWRQQGTSAPLSSEVLVDSPTRMSGVGNCRPGVRQERASIDNAGRWAAMREPRAFNINPSAKSRSFTAFNFP
jgi:hypothetical protein